jgi:TonB family protein
MPSTSYAGRTRFGLLPEPESNPASFLTSCIINGAILALLIIFGTVAHHEIEVRKMESTEIIFPTTPPPPLIKVKVKVPPAPKAPELPMPKVAKLEPPKIKMPRIEPKPEPKPLPMVKEALAMPKVAAPKPSIVLAPQPKAAFAAAAPALAPQQHPSVTPVHLGDMNGVRPNPNATRPATVAALGNPYGGSEGKAEAPRGVVGSAGFGNSVKSGSNAGSIGKVASAGFPGATGTDPNGSRGTQGKVASAGFPGTTAAGTGPERVAAVESKTTPPVLLSHAQPEYTSEAKQLRIQGDVVLRVTITTSGQMVVRNVIHGLGHGLDESAMKSAPTYKFRPATQNGQPVDYTTNIIIKFQTA